MATGEHLMRDRGWAQRLLAWREAGPLLQAEVSRCRYFILEGIYETVAWGEVRDLGGRYRVDLGSWDTVAEAQRACEEDARRRCQRSEEERPRVSVRIL